VLYYYWVLNTWVYPNEEQRLLLALLLLFAAYIGARLCSLVNVAVKKVDKVIESDIEEANPYNDTDELDDGYESAYLNNGEDDEDESSCAGVDTNELKLILYQDVTILAVRVGDCIVLAMFIIIIHGKGED
jgi:hypothetical protein